VFKVAGDTCEPALNPEAGAELVDAVTGLAIWNGSTALKPVDCGEDALDEDALDEVSELIASSAVAAAPRANSMAKLRQVPLDAANLPRRLISKPHATRKNPVNGRFLWPERSGTPGN
jgi:hypothetical protein